LRFGLPKDYNDPYELFLLPDGELDGVEERAFYEFFLRNLPQVPVTCFSRRPDSVVMWAHYCQLGSGVCLAIDEEAILSEVDLAYLEDVVYSDEPARVATSLVARACTTKKLRHTESVLASANLAAYLTKRRDWAYERECRMIVLPDAVFQKNNMLLARFTAHCLKYVIVGPKATKETSDHVKRWADKSGVDLLEMQCSRRRHDPFFTADNRTFEWASDRFEASPFRCAVCREPLVKQLSLCEWCQITEGEKRAAGQRNAMVLALHLGVMKGVPFALEGLELRGKRHTQRPVS
jgi:hypothetical protein